MTQIKIFSEHTYSGSSASPDVTRIKDLEKQVNDFLATNADKITVKDVKYYIQSPNPHQIFNLSVKDWIVMVIYETH